MFRSIRALAVALTLSLSLAACTPPMPPEVIAALAEQEYTCVEGETNLSLPAATTDVGDGWAVSAAEACPGMTILPSFDTPDGADLVFTTTVTDMAVCKPSVNVPFAVDAAVLVYISPEGATLALTPKLVSEIFSGQVSDWSDASISEANQGMELPAGPILLHKVASKAVIESFTSWFGHLGQNVNLSSWKISEITSDELNGFEPGTLALIPNSLATENAFTPIGIQLGKDFDSVINPDALSIGSAATQYEISKTATSVTVSYNPKIKPQPAPGQDVASVPYGAVYTYDLGICGEPTLAKRAIARFILRMDQQGSMGSTYFVPITEQMRVEALAIVSEGLTLPSINPEDLTAE